MGAASGSCPPSGLSLDFQVPVSSLDGLMSVPVLQQTLLAENPLGKPADEFELLQFLLVEGPGLATGAGNGFAEEAIRLGFFRDPQSGMIIEAFNRPGEAGFNLFVTQLAAPDLDDTLLLRNALARPPVDLAQVRERMRHETGRQFLSHRPDTVSIYALVATPALNSEIRRMVPGVPAVWVSGLYSPSCNEVFFGISSVIDDTVVLAGLRDFRFPLSVTSLFIDEVAIRAALLTLKLFAGAFLFGLSIPAAATPVTLAIAIFGLILFAIGALLQMLAIAKLLNANNPAVLNQIQALTKQLQQLRTSVEQSKQRAESLEQRLNDGEQASQQEIQQTLNEVREALRSLDGTIKEAMNTLDPESRARTKEIKKILDSNLEKLKGTPFEDLLPKDQ